MLRASARTAYAALLAGLLAGCTSASSVDGNGAVYAAWAAQRSRVEVTARGSVARVLGVRSGPSGRHEGFLLHLRGAAGRGLTVRVEDNIDITGPIPIAPGDDAEVRGEYVFDPRGGLIHYTHHDPRGRHASGYVSVNGHIYQ